MLAKKLFPLLARSDVQELSLQSGRPPMALRGGEYQRLSAQLLRDDDIMGVLAAAGGSRHLARLADGVTWEFEVAGVGPIRITAEHDGLLIKASLQRAVAEVAAEKPAPARAPAQEAPPPKPAPIKPAAAPANPAPVKPAPAPAPAKPARAPSVDLEAFPTADGNAVPYPVAPVPDEPEAWQEPTPAEAHVVTSHDGFNFEAAAAWASRPPPPMPTQAAGQPVYAAAVKFSGDAVDTLLGQARVMHASDAHVLADRPFTLRIAGELVPVAEPISAELIEPMLLSRIPEKLRASFERDGSCDFSLVHPAHGRFRANITRQRTGMKLTARPIGQSVPTLAELGLPESIGKALHHHQGLIVIAGPTGSGKTTTLAALVGMINRDTTHHVITVEDPIEYVHENAKAVISQREVGTHTKTFQSALKASLREDPDVIVVGELRDTETVRMALSASETGHLVISTMNTPSASKAIERLIDLFPPGDQPQVRMTLAGGLRLIIAQRLLPTADRKSLCAAAEILPGVPQLWALIRDDRTFQIPSLQQRGKGLGITRLDESLAYLVKAGRTSMEIAKEYADSPEFVESVVSGKPLIAQPVDPNAKPPSASKTGGNAPVTQGAQASAMGQAAKQAASAQAAGKEMGKQLLSKAGKLFNRDDS